MEESDENSTVKAVQFTGTTNSKKPTCDYNPLELRRKNASSLNADIDFNDQDYGAPTHRIQIE